ncbi:MAG: grasp-with-spasm system ATP-grasp peptide maturase [Bacteroidota bacterium]
MDRYILLISQRIEPTTDKVMDWLDTKGVSMVRLNGEDLLDDHCISVRLSKPEDSSLMINGVPGHQISAVWFRRFLPPITNEREDKELSTVIGHRQQEMEACIGVLKGMLDVPWLTSPSQIRRSKWQMLQLAKSVGLEVPDSIISTSGKQVREYLDASKAYITKPLSEATFFSLQEKTYGMYTQEVKADALPESFVPSLIQEQVPKAYELRVFYLKGRVYPMAIFSQQNDQTAMDFRMYDRARPNRRTPYTLSEELTRKLQRFMEAADLETGSIDMIVTPDGREVFLEVNPIGQLGMVSLPCNYQLEERIAHTLIQMANQNQEGNYA